ncbi:MAG TPA: hypothetical protein VMI56_10305 [Reyranella sp.]|nr:hypothetical protein [Reyranella sp.]
MRFYARCAREAWRRSWDAANAWRPVLALLVLYGGARLAGLDLTFPGEGEFALAIGTGLFIVVAWLTVFLVQMIAVPPRFDAELRAQLERPIPQPVATIALPPAPEPIKAAPAPRKVLPRIDVRLHDQMHETAAIDSSGGKLPVSRAYRARITNRGDKPIHRCQLFFNNLTHIQVVSGPFDLAPGEHRDLPVLRVIDEADEPHALLYFLDRETWKVATGQAAWLPEPGRFKVRVLSADAPATSLEVELSRSTGTPLAWTLVEAAEVEEAPAGRKRKSRAIAEAIVEPSSGD